MFVDEKLSIAPMLDWTDPHYRALMRGVTRKTVLYSEMVVDETLMYAPNPDFFIGKFDEYSPSVIQLGGHDPEMLAKATEFCDQYSENGKYYQEINLNCGCPSQRVAQRCFGAKLMLEPELVRDIVHQMQRRTQLPVTVKCRIGVDDIDSYDALKQFIRTVHEGGVKKFILHARKCLLNGLTTKQNRDIPPLHYEIVHQLVKEFPDFQFILNGGITSFDQGLEHLENPWQFQPTPQPATNDFVIGENTEESTPPTTVFNTLPATTNEQMRVRKKVNRKFDITLPTEYLGDTVDDSTGTLLYPAVHGVMIGRTAYNNPILFTTADSTFYRTRDPCLTRRQIIEKYLQYCTWIQSEEGPRRMMKGGRVQMVSTSVLINSMRNIICGIPHVQKFRTALNDIYMDQLRLDKENPNPDPRFVVSYLLLVDIFSSLFMELICILFFHVD